MLEVRSGNLMDLAAGLPRAADGTDMRDSAMEPLAREILGQAATDGQQLVQMLMLVLRN